MLPPSVIAKDYICRLCGSHLALRPNPKTGRTCVYCVADDEHFGWIKRSSAELQEFVEWMRLLALLRDPVLSQSVPDWPKVEAPPVERCYAELYE
jgi:hypothetical protein